MQATDIITQDMVGKSIYEVVEQEHLATHIMAYHMALGDLAGDTMTNTANLQHALESAVNSFRYGYAQAFVSYAAAKLGAPLKDIYPDLDMPDM